MSLEVKGTNGPGSLISEADPRGANELGDSPFNVCCHVILLLCWLLTKLVDCCGGKKTIGGVVVQEGADSLWISEHVCLQEIIVAEVQLSSVLSEHLSEAPLRRPATVLSPQRCIEGIDYIRNKFLNIELLLIVAANVHVSIDHYSQKKVQDENVDCNEEENRKDLQFHVEVPPFEETALNHHF